MDWLYKIKHYNIGVLIKVIVYKICFSIILHIEKLYIRVSHIKLVYLENIDSNNIKKIKLTIIPYKNHIDKANKILEGNMNIFNLDFKFENFLQDPISQKEWPRNTFFSEAKTKIEGYGDVKYILELNKLNHLVYVASAYMQTNEEKYTQYIQQHIELWQKEVPYERSVANRIIMDIAFRVINLIFVSICCAKSKYFIDKIYPRIHQILKLSEHQMRKFCTPKWFKTGNGANHVIGEMVGLIILQKWLAHIENKPLNKKSITQEYKWLYKTLDRLIAPTGVYLENSANYTRLVCEFLVCLHIFEQIFENTNLQLLENRYLRPILQYLQSLSYEHELPNFGDNDAASILIPFKENFADISPLTFYLNRLTNQMKKNDTNIYSKNGHFIWDSHTKNRIHIFIRSGKWSIFRPGANSHVHCDLLSILLYAKGFPIFVDKGCFFYNQSNEIKKACISTVSHNTISIQGYEQADYNNGWFNYPQSNILATDSKNNIFKGIAIYKGFSHTRSLYYKDNTLIVKDNIQGVPTNSKSYLNYILSEAIEVDKIDKFSILLSIAHKPLAKISFEGVKVEIIKEEYYPHYGHSKNTHALRGIILSNTIVTNITFI